MEVWALQSYGAAFTLKEMLTFKADSLESRDNVYKFTFYGSLINSTNRNLHIDLPASFDAMAKELMGLSLLAKFVKTFKIRTS